MSAYEHYINQFRADQHQDDRMREGSAERMIRAIHSENNKEMRERMITRGQSGVGHAQHPLISRLGSRLRGAAHNLGSGPRLRHGHSASR